MLQAMGIVGKARKTAVRQIGEAAERSSCWLWHRRDDLSWKPSADELEPSEDIKAPAESNRDSEMKEDEQSREYDSRKAAYHYLCLENDHKTNIPTKRVKIWAMEVVEHSPNRKTYQMKSKYAYGPQIIDVQFRLIYKKGDIPLDGSCSSNVEPTEEPETTTTQQPVSTKYDYAKVIELSILFYEAQRSGKLSPDNRIPYRGDSALNDKGFLGEDLTGGWYDGKTK
ncbi:E3.2.1.4 [Mytilus coruscus]|uniref:cellulase n=1 Tax=Mytilus coruscus TaxID=42192 RepID=A0A6J8BCF9_MYTCO|nr:E3.2.1.4 [Mytilus coruscus]